MVVVRLSGGLGNQMFQYAAGRRIALINKTPLKLDISSFDNDKLRTYSLCPFNIQEAFANQQELTSIKMCRRLVLHLPQKFHLLSPWKFFREDYIGPVDPNLLEVSGNVYLDGYWQSWKYFNDVEDIIRAEFMVKLEADPANEAMAQQIQDVNAVSLHVRRGDYVSNPFTNQIHGTCSLDYYAEAAALITRLVKSPHIFIFSDDPHWVQENLRLEHPVTFITHNPPEKGYEDLRLMSLCRHHIIANSSFSWWGAWLCAHPNKIVIAPAKWFNHLKTDTSDLIPDSWRRI